MKVAFYLNSLSFHQLPLAREVVVLIGSENFVYIYRDKVTKDRERFGWGTLGNLFQDIKCRQGDDRDEILRSWDVVYTGIRCLDLMELRSKRGLKTFYYSERWLKPITRFGIELPGWCRLLIPSYRRMVQRFVSLTNKDNIHILSVGLWAKTDFIRLGVRAEMIIDWGYFVTPSKVVKRQDGVNTSMRSCKEVLRILWVGRLLPLKRVDTILKASYICMRKVPLQVTIVGDGPLEKELKQLASRLFQRHLNVVRFLHSVPFEQVRELMQSHNVYVLSSNAHEGWGAVVSEALEEGMEVLGTFESGACITLLPQERLYHCGDTMALARLLEQEYDGVLPQCSIGKWTANHAAYTLCYY